MTAYEQVKAINEETKSCQIRAAALLELAILDAAKTAFDEHPKLRSFQLVGYHPAFNDGDPCSFSFQTEPEQINGTPNPDYGSEYDDDEDYDVKPADWDRGREWDDATHKYAVVREPGWAIAAAERIGTLFSAFTEHQIEAKFGSNFSLTFTKDAEGKVNYEKDSYYCGY